MEIDIGKKVGSIKSFVSSISSTSFPKTNKGCHSSGCLWDIESILFIGQTKTMEFLTTLEWGVIR